MPISTALCGPKTIAHITRLPLNEIIAVCGWTPEAGTSPSGMCAGLNRLGWEAEYRQNNQIFRLEEERKSGAEIIINQWSMLFGTPDGHYVHFLGISSGRNVLIWDSDRPELEKIEYTIDFFNLCWFDYSVPDFDLLYRPAIITRKKR